MSTADYLETRDGARIYYEDRGEGQPVVLVHGWLCSSKFWQKNVPALAKAFRVVTMDLRGHGNSSKGLSGHTIRQYAADVREVIEHLRLQEVVLAGWSLAGPVVISCCRQYGSDSRLKALALIDCTLFPFSPAAWNSHPLRGYNYDRLHATFAAYTADPRQFATDFTVRMFKQTPSPEDMDWVVAEMLKTPPWIAEAIYSDFVMSDLSGALPAIEIPLIVFAANSGVFPKGIDMGRAFADLAPHASLIPFADAGHMLFYEQPERFNAALAGFIKGL